MSESDHNPAEVIQAYRRRRQRTVPILMGAAATLLLVAGLVLVALWISGDSPPSLPVLFASDTPTVTLTSTAPPPSETPTITLTPTETLTPTPSGPQSYIVQEGDTLTTIAEAFSIELDLLLAYNPELADGGTIFVSQEIIIPPPDAEFPTSTPLPDNLLPGARIEYVVRAGDTLASIAAEFNSTVDAIIDENDLEDPNDIGIGDRLIIPVNLVTPAPTNTVDPNPPTATATLIP